MQDIIHASTNYLDNMIHSQSTAIRAEVEHVQRQLKATELSKQENDVIESFEFPGMFARQDRIDPAAHRTFQWILEDNENKSWDSFREWLQNDKPVYWISGKPGSGKSTLMNYIWSKRHEDRKMPLQKWAGTRKLIIAAVFFWNPGSELQKSILGLMRSLVYQGKCWGPSAVPFPSKFNGILLS